MRRIPLLVLALLLLWGCGFGSPPPQEPAPPPAQVDLAPLEQKVAQLEANVAKLRKDVDMVMAVRFPKAKKK